MDLPFVDNMDCTKNQLTNIFEGRIPIEKGASFLYYTEIGKTKSLIHQLKYKSNQEVGSFVGNWFGKILLDTKQLDDIDGIIPVPLHVKKLRKRGYNQLTTFGKSLSNLLKVDYHDSILKRVSSAKTQTLKKRLERFDNSNSKFTLENSVIIENKHILLIDDVVTTGATLEACSLELLKIKGVRISIITIALTL